MKIKRGDIYLADLGEGYGSEQGESALFWSYKTTKVINTLILY